MKTALQKKRTLLVSVWVIFLALAFLFFILIEQHSNEQKAKLNLQNQAGIVASQLPSITRTDFFLRYMGEKATLSKMKALDLALSELDDIAGAEAFLDDYARAAGVERLMIWDRDGNEPYRFGPDHGISQAQRKEYIPLIEKETQQSIENYEFSSDYTQLMFSSPETKEESFWHSRKIKDKWYLLIDEYDMAPQRAEAVESFLWTGVLKRIRIGDNGFLFAADILKNPGTILACPDEKELGKPIEALDIRLMGQNGAASLDSILQAFGDDGRVEKIRVSGTDYYATRVQQGDVLMLALVPTSESAGKGMEMALILLLLTMLMTGLLMLYVYFHIVDQVDVSDPESRRQLFLRYSSRSVLGLVITLVISMLLATMSIYADTFAYCQNKVTQMVEILYENGQANQSLTAWIEDEYLTKCRIAECLLKYRNYEADRQSLNELSDALDLKTIHLFDGAGNTVATNSDFYRLEVKEDSPFQALLEGKPDLVGKIETDPLSGKLVQKIGVSIRTRDHRVDGFVMVTLDPVEANTVFDALKTENICQQLCLMNDTSVLAIDKDMIIRYVAEVNDGVYEPGLFSFDYSGLPVSSLDISEEKLRDNFNGNMLVLQNRFFASIRRADDYYYMVMRPQITLGSGQSITVLSAMGAVLLFIILVHLISTLNMWKATDGQDGSPDGEEEPSSTPYEDEDYFISVVAGKKDWAFKDRWPNDGTKWKDKTSSEKFDVVAKWIFLLAFIGTGLQIAFRGEKSIWYFWQTSSWDSGVNLYSVTSCLITGAVLVLVKVVAHRFLFQIARTVDAKGETICLLLDSMMGYILFIIGVFICLANFGVNTETLSLTGGVAGVIFGIGCKNIVDDILAGIIMTFEGVVHVGDFVSYNRQWGGVRCIGVRSTQIKFCGDLIIIRNNDFKNFINLTTFGDDTRIKVYVNVSLQESLERIEGIIREEMPAIQERIEAELGKKLDEVKYRGVSRITESGMSLSFAAYCNGRYYGKVERALNRELKLMCDRNNIRIALPQVVVHDAEQRPEQ